MNSTKGHFNCFILAMASLFLATCKSQANESVNIILDFRLQELTKDNSLFDKLITNIFVVRNANGDSLFTQMQRIKVLACITPKVFSGSNDGIDYLIELHLRTEEGAKGLFSSLSFDEAEAKQTLNGVTFTKLIGLPGETWGGFREKVLVLRTRRYLDSEPAKQLSNVTKDVWFALPTAHAARASLDISNFKSILKETVSQSFPENGLAREFLHTIDSISAIGISFDFNETEIANLMVKPNDCSPSQLRSAIDGWLFILRTSTAEWLRENGFVNPTLDRLIGDALLELRAECNEGIVSVRLRRFDDIEVVFREFEQLIDRSFSQ